MPYWHSIIHAGKRRQCVAFCDEEGKLKHLPFDHTATAIWDENMHHDFGHGCSPDHLVGQIAVVIGDEEFWRRCVVKMTKRQASTKTLAEESRALSRAIRPLLAGKDPVVQSAALADLVSLYLAG